MALHLIGAANVQAVCTPLLTAAEMYPDVIKDGTQLRTMMKATCNMTHPLWFFTGAGDNWIASRAYGSYRCGKQWAWIDGFYTTMAKRLNREEWYVLDVGGNMGQEPIIAANHGFKAYTFEPFAFNVATLKFNAALNCVPDLVNVIQAGASDAPGEACFQAAPAKNHISNAGHSVRRGGTGSSCIKMTSLDVARETTFDAGRRPLLLKLDCEGAEAMSLKGARKLLTETPPVVILVEIQLPGHRLPIYRETLKEYGYAIYSLWGGDSNLPCDTGCEPMRATYWEDHHNRSSDHTALQASLEIIAVHVQTVKHYSHFHGVFDRSRLAMAARSADKGY